jgi:hypothetical protein
MNLLMKLTSVTSMTSNTGHKTLDIQNCQKMLGWYYYDDGTDSNNGNLRLN